MMISARVIRAVMVVNLIIVAIALAIDTKPLLKAAIISYAVLVLLLVWNATEQRGGDR